MDIEETDDMINDIEQSDDLPMKKQKSGWGERLKTARESMQLTEKEAASRLHLNPRIIAVIEGEDFENGPPIIFMRGYLRSYARLLNIPENEIDQAVTQLEIAVPSQNVSNPIALQTQTQSFDSGQRYMRWITYPIVAVLIALVGMWWSNHSRNTADIDTASNTKTTLQITPQAETKATTIPVLSSAATSPTPAGIQPAANAAGVIATSTTPAPLAQQQLPQAVPTAIGTTTAPTKVMTNPNPVATAKPLPVVTQQPKPTNQPAQGNTAPSQPDINNLGMALPEPGLE